jgi:hypothetical protein
VTPFTYSVESEHLMPSTNFAVSWSWLTQVFGTEGALLVACFAMLSLCSWLFTPILILLLHGKMRTLASRVEELYEQVAALHRYQQVERLRKDRAPRRGGR